MNRIKGFNNCSATVTDIPSAMTEKKIGLMRLLKENCVTFPIHQGRWEIVVDITNMLKSGKSRLMHWKLTEILL